MMEKTDFKKTLKQLYQPSAKQIEFVDVPPLNYLAVTGQGRPEGETYQQALQALYPVAYSIKFWMKQNAQYDFIVPPLEGLWWADDYTDFIKGNRDNWRWTMLIMQPAKVTQAIVDTALNAVAAKKTVPKALDSVEFLTINEGPCAQILHLGPFNEEGPVIQRLHDAIEDSGAQLSGKHHEIYLSDIRRVPPEKYRTVLRQPMSATV